MNVSSSGSWLAQVSVNKRGPKCVARASEGSSTESEEIRRAVGHQSSVASSRRNLVEDSLSFPAPRCEQAGLCACNALESVRAKLLPASFLDVGLSLEDNRR